MGKPDDFPALAARYVTSHLPGIGGRLKAHNEDFFVEEIPSYTPCGRGEHLYLFIEKNGRPTLEVVRDLARHFRVPRKAIGYAGMKDKYAVTRQWLSVHTPDDDRLTSLQIPGVDILTSGRHLNKLRIGHLRGNRFVIRIRDVEPEDADRARSALDELCRVGAPNAVGEQRFGYRRHNHRIGRCYLLQDWEGMCRELLGIAEDPDDHEFEARRAFDAGDYKTAAQLWPESLACERTVAQGLARGYSAEQAVLASHASQRSFFISAFQSALFNQILDHRIEHKWFQQLLEGDVAFKHANGASFRIGAAELEDPSVIERLHSIDISPSGAMWGYNMLPASGMAGDVERHVLEHTGVDLECFVTPPHDIKGTRRPLRIPVRDAQVTAGSDEHGHYIETSFQLPKGSFATTILREILKTEERAYPWGTNRAHGQRRSDEGDESETTS